MRAAILVALTAILLVGGYIWQNRDSKAPAAEEAVQEQTYMNTEHGISFIYPNTYVLEERELGNGERWHHNITLMDREAAANIPQNGEGPPSITIDIIQNNLDNLSVAEWVNNDSRSNFKLSLDGVLASTTVAGQEAVQYTWDGLYRGESVVFQYKSSVVMLSVTYMTPTDAIQRDFQDIVNSFTLN